MPTTEFLEPCGAAGAAFLLKAPARESTVLYREGAKIAIRQDAPYVTVELPTVPQPEESLLALSWKILQEALDIHAATHRKALITSRAECESIRWTRGKKGFDLFIADTTDIPWSIGGSVNSDSGQGVKENAEVEHHLSLRFHRLSLASDDLFDAFRNAYLALECFVSEESELCRRDKEREAAWLKRVLSGLSHAGVPIDSNIAQIVELIYFEGRLPLFHAKMERDFYLGNESERERIRALLENVHLLLTVLFHHRYDKRFASGWGELMQIARDEMLKAVLVFDEGVYQSGIVSEAQATKIEIVDLPRKFDNISAIIELPPPKSLSSIDALDLRVGKQSCLVLKLPEPISMDNVDRVRVELAFTISSVRAPKAAHAT